MKTSTVPKTPLSPKIHSAMPAIFEFEIEVVPKYLSRQLSLDSILVIKRDGSKRIQNFTNPNHPARVAASDTKSVISFKVLAVKQSICNKALFD